ncbi:MAG: NINE protein [Armatimonadota bacterium]
MYCRNCGNQVQNQAAVCMQCGSYPNTGIRFCPNCGAQPDPTAVICVRCGVSLTQRSYVPPTPGMVGAKSKLTAGLLGIFLGGFGVHRFYLGYSGTGVLQLILTVVTCGLASWWGFIEGILILAGSTITTDAEGRPLTD